MKRLLAVAMLLGCTAVQAAERQNAERVNQEVTCGEYGKLVEEVGKEQTLSGKRVIAVLAGLLYDMGNAVWNGVLGEPRTRADEDSGAERAASVVRNVAQRPTPGE